MIEYIFRIHIDRELNKKKNLYNVLKRVGLHDCKFKNKGGYKELRFKRKALFIRDAISPVLKGLRKTSLDIGFLAIEIDSITEVEDAIHKT